MPVFIPKDEPTERIGDDVKVLGYTDYDPSYKPHEVRTNAPYQAGDMTYAFVHGAGIRRIRIRRVRAKYLKSRDYLIPAYSAQFETAKGTWSRVCRLIYPGDIYRAHFDSNDKLRPGMFEGREREAA